MKSEPPSQLRNPNQPERTASDQSQSYAAVGVDTHNADESIRALTRSIEATFAFHPAKPLLPLGYFANVVQLTPDLGLAISTDGVGTKLLVAQALRKYDTVGIDCIAMNANDIICVGARPFSMVDYVAVDRAEPSLLAAIAAGLHDGAREAGISIPGGEIAQLREMLHVNSGGGFSFELVGTCVGTVHPQRLVIGRDIEPGDVVIGLASRGLHSNGFTLARQVLLQSAQLPLEDIVPELGRPLGEELLEPTRIYVRPVVHMLDAGLRIKALIHITGDGLLNLTRVASASGFVIDRLLPIHPIFALIQQRGAIDTAEMFRVFNMGIGFCVVTHPDDADRVMDIAKEHGDTAAPIGYAVADSRRRVWIPAHGLVSEDKAFRPAREPTPLKVQRRS